MVTPPDIEAQILRYYHAEKWTIGTIARQLHIHHSVVRRVLAQAGLPRVGRASRPSKIDAYLSFIRQTLESFPTLTASRLYVMAYQRGYRGSPDHFRHLIACHRPRPKAEAYLRLRTLPGEEGQVDWGHFGHLEIGRARRPLMAFVMVLSYSRQIFLRFFLDARMENFLRGHVAAFEAWQGVTSALLPGLRRPRRDSAVVTLIARIGRIDSSPDANVVIRTGVKPLPDSRAGVRVQPCHPSAGAKIVAGTADDDPVAGDKGAGGQGFATFEAGRRDVPADLAGCAIQRDCMTVKRVQHDLPFGRDRAANRRVATGQAGGATVGRRREGPADRRRLLMDIERVQRVRERCLQQQQIARDRRGSGLAAQLAGAEVEYQLQPSDVAGVNLA